MDWICIRAAAGLVTSSTDADEAILRFNLVSGFGEPETVFGATPL